MNAQALRAVHQARHVAASLGEHLAHRTVRRDHAEGREHFGTPALVQVVEFRSLGADTERVQNRGLPVVGEDVWFGLETDRGKVEAHGRFGATPLSRPSRSVNRSPCACGLSLLLLAPPHLDPAQILQPLLAGLGGDLRGWALAWARVTPALTLLPALGLSALPAQTRAALGLALAVSIAPSLQPAQLEAPFAVALLLEAARGLPVALAASGALWAAGMAGGLIDNIRGARETQALPVVDEETSPLGALLSLLVALVFLEGGGAARVAAALSENATVSHGTLWQ